MTALDHRILIPAPPQAVWAYLSDLANLPEWQVDCEYMTFLSQKRQGIGTRWRQRSGNRQEHVYEVVSWYDALGFEYILIDGAPFKSVQGRVRLQEIPEGTIVQWSFNYELGGGMLGGLRNALTTERRQDTIMVDSLKTLWKQARRLGSLENYVPRSMMQDGPQDPEQRASYTSNRATQSNEIISSGSSGFDSAFITEPPISDEDTRPRLSVTDADILPSHSSTEDTPQTTADPTESKRATDEHERFAPPERPSFTNTPPTPITPPPAPIQPQETPLSSDVTPESEGDTPPPALTPEPDATTPSRPPRTVEPTPTPPELEPEETFPDPFAPETTQTEEPSSPVAADDVTPQIPEDRDTAEVSIWEVFGIPSPTDTQRMRAIQAAEEAEAEYEAEADVEEPQAPAETEAATATVETKATDATSEVPVTTTPDDQKTAVVAAVVDDEESQDKKADDPTPLDNVETPAEELPLQPGRTGVRSRLRRRTIHIRRPGE